MLGEARSVTRNGIQIEVLRVTQGRLSDITDWEVTLAYTSAERSENGKSNDLCSS